MSSRARIANPATSAAVSAMKRMMTRIKGKKAMKKRITAREGTSDRTQLMLETPYAGKHHGNAVLIACGNYVLILDGAARLDDCVDPELRDFIYTVAEWKERVRRKRRPPGVL